MRRKFVVTMKTHLVDCQRLPLNVTQQRRIPKNELVRREKNIQLDLLLSLLSEQLVISNSFS
jgi:hypothetical protein